MTELPDALFLNPVWHALRGPHRHLAIDAGAACRYAADVAPFAAISEPGGETNRQLHGLLAPGESLWITGDARHPGLEMEQELDCLQMVLPLAAPLPPAGAGIVPLTAAEAPEMVALTDLAFPGFFRPATYKMGSYYGVRADGELIAMAGERLRLDGFPELSGICTHPEFRGRGLAAGLIGHLTRIHRRDGLISWLHVGASNTRAIDLYRELGFKAARNLLLRRIRRTG